MSWFLGHFCQLQYKDVLLSNLISSPCTFQTSPSHPSPKGSHDFLSLFQFWVTYLRPMTSRGHIFFWVGNILVL